MKRVLITGATGQIGSELTMVLREKLGNANVVAAGRVKKPDPTLLGSGKTHDPKRIQPHGHDCCPRNHRSGHQKAHAAI